MSSMSKLLRLLAGLLAVSLLVAACSSDDDDSAGQSGDDTSDTTGDGDDDEITLVQEGSALEAIKEAREIKCGTRDALPGFAVLTEDGDHVGFDADFCRVVAAAILGDASAVNFVDLETAARFTALQSGEIDILIRNTTWTAGRDGNEGATFLQTTFYDGTAMMVAADSEFESMADMDGTTICVASGTTNEGAVALEFQRLGLQAEVLSFDDTSLIQEAFISGRCDGWSSDASQLVALRSEFPDGPDALKILPDVVSKEPLGPAVLDGNGDLAQAANWAIFATIQAEEFGITSENVDEFLDSDDPTIRKFLGVDEEGGTFDPGLGLPPDFAVQVISQVGNYGEIFEEHLAPLGLERGPNALWSDGGLLYSPPYR